MYILCYYSAKVNRVLVMTFVRGDQAQVHDGSPAARIIMNTVYPVTEVYRT